MHDEAAKEETHQQRRFEIRQGRIGCRCAVEAKKKQESPDEERRIVGVDDSPRKKAQVNGGHPPGNRQQPVTAPLRFLRWRGVIGLWCSLSQCLQVPAEIQIVRNRRQRNRKRSVPAELGQHERRVPFPDPRHHQHRWRREVRQRSTDRHVDEQEAERGVFQRDRRLQVVELAPEQQRGNRHGAGLRNDGAKKRGHDQESPATMPPA